MEKNEILDAFNGMCERCLMKGIITTLGDAKTLCEVFDRFRNNSYKNDKEYSDDILYFYNLGVKLHTCGVTSLEESYAIYRAILSADSIDFVETNESIMSDNDGEVNVVKNKRNKKSKLEVGVL